MPLLDRATMSAPKSSTTGACGCSRINSAGAGAGAGAGSRPAPACATDAAEATALEAAPGCPVGFLNSRRDHPLDPLSPEEIRAAVSITQAARRAAGCARDGPIVATKYIKVELEEPSKPSILALAIGDAPPPRRAYLQFVEVYRPSAAALAAAGAPTWAGGGARAATAAPSAGPAGRVMEAVACLTTGKLHSSRTVTKGQPPMSSEEYHGVSEAVKKDPRFQHAMARRGVTDMDRVMVDPWCVGYFTDDDSAAHGRLSFPIIFVCTGDHDDNGYARPVVNLELRVDMLAMKVLSVKDKGLVPLPEPDPLRHWTKRQLKVKTRTDCKPLRITQPEGPSFTVTGNHIEWQGWQFRVGFTATEGLVLHNVALLDRSKGKVRSIAYRMSYAEMIVPYGDPRTPHYRKNALDAGEDGLGRNANSLSLGCDCLGLIRYFDTHLVTEAGEVETIKKAICLHEEDFGTLWKHTDWRTDECEVRRARRLVVSFVATVANYEYGFYWMMYQDGRIESEHFWVVRMDMAVDGVRNSVAEVNVEADPVHLPENRWGGAFRAHTRILKSEVEARRNICTETARYWKVLNPSAKNRTGTPTSYKLIPGHTSFYKGAPTSRILDRAGFLRHHLWVTRYSPKERYPAGDFPNQNTDEGLPIWTQRNAPLENEDCVMWYLFGVTHSPSLEDWPIMPCERVGFSLHPSGFFDCSAAMDVAPEGAEARCSKEVPPAGEPLRSKL